MFIIKLFKRLFEYLRRLWLFWITVVAGCALGIYIVLNDTNPYEMTGTMCGIFIIAFSIFVFIGSGVAHAILAFKRSMYAAKTEKPKSVAQMLWVHIVAFLIHIVIAALIILVVVLLLTKLDADTMYYSFDAANPYSSEFVLYIIAVIFAVYLIPTAIIAVSRLKVQEKPIRVFFLVFAIILFAMLMLSVMTESFMIAWYNSPGFELAEVWAMNVFLVTNIAIGDIAAYSLTYFTLKAAISDAQNDNQPTDNNENQTVSAG